MAIDQGLLNATRYSTVPVHSDFTFPDADWAWVMLIRPQTAINLNYPLSTGTWGETDSFNILAEDLTANVSGTAIFWDGGNLTLDNWYFVYLTRRNSLLSIGGINLNDHTNSSETASPASITTSHTMPGPVTIGSREDLSAGRFFSGQWAHVIYSNKDSISFDEAMAVATGKITLSETRVFKSRVFHAGGHTADHVNYSDLTGRHIVTVNGTGYGVREEDPQELVVFSQRNRKIFIPAVFGAGAGAGVATGRLFFGVGA